jgi:hypothetical protein
MIALGLDISTSCTGWCVLDCNEKIVETGYIDTSKEKSIFKKGEFVKSVLTAISKKYKIEKIFVEENLQAFRSGFSSARTISALSKFNGIVSFSCFEIFNIEPIFFNVNTARKSLGIKIKRKKDGGLPVKDQLYVWAMSNVDYKWPEKKLKSGPRKGEIVVDPRSHDMIDAYIVSRAGIIDCKI